jgi:hypothetical protein
VGVDRRGLPEERSRPRGPSGLCEEHEPQRVGRTVSAYAQGGGERGEGDGRVRRRTVAVWMSRGTTCVRENRYPGDQDDYSDAHVLSSDSVR